MKKGLFIFLLIIVVIGGVFFYVRYYVPYSSSSVIAGELNYVMYKGVIFKTWEGKLIQSGFRSKVAGAVQSNEFDFSIENEELAKKLMNLPGSSVKLHYKEYYGVLPWRGYTKYIVDSIVAIDTTSPVNTPFPFE
jgi:hypothetical protein